MADKDDERIRLSDEFAKGDDSEPMLYCPVCNARLIGHKCKLICERCGYYMSCADYY